MSDDTKRLNVVISTDLHRDLKVEVAKRGTTIAQFVAEAIAEKIKKKGASNKWHEKKFRVLLTSDLLLWFIRTS